MSIFDEKPKKSGPADDFSGVISFRDSPAGMDTIRPDRPSGASPDGAFLPESRDSSQPPEFREETTRQSLT